ncbi:TlpA family protein disulfide reductase [Candidatus Venteria ishoeyi]|uniref:Thiol-disulfide oxidoreductase ResA n=1 Tax=Candidatus Venteria ishoeyi TaxID=1899563 RepID=A0A1H6F496_9GAMM|nr:TlpA disulfide reductase family protein [Candidatus Venteria ishoeyi]MDM8545743.1 TlpA disulfide reductase family protein [Candidatus Venteria ishoeyi]SEH04393.1 Thiol-disulfide oxidoreductase ResA [Candidatus Venteria ishoeyi]
MKTVRLLGLCCTLLWLSGCSQAAQVEEIMFEDLLGTQHKLSDYQGKWVVLNYWATWCPPCLRELPTLNDFHAMSEHAVVLGVNEDRIKNTALSNFVQNHEIDYPIIPNSKGQQSKQTYRKLRQDFPFQGLPTTYIIDPKGEIVARHSGEISLQQLDFLTQK